jgi:hypothetical protein
MFMFDIFLDGSQFIWANALGAVLVITATVLITTKGKKEEANEAESEARDYEKIKEKE